MGAGMHPTYNRCAQAGTVVSAVTVADALGTGPALGGIRHGLYEFLRPADGYGGGDGDRLLIDGLGRHRAQAAALGVEGVQVSVRKDDPEDGTSVLFHYAGTFDRITG